MAEADLSDVLPLVAVPTLLLWGELDARSPLRVAHEFAEAIPRAELVVVEGAGHMSPLEEPQQVNAVCEQAEWDEMVVKLQSVLRTFD